MEANDALPHSWQTDRLDGISLMSSIYIILFAANKIIIRSFLSCRTLQQCATAFFIQKLGYFIRDPIVFSWYAV